MAVDATTLFEQLQSLSASEQEVFTELFHRWEAEPVERSVAVAPSPGRPDFIARMKEDFPKGIPPGKPVSEIVDEGRGPRP